MRDWKRRYYYQIQQQQSILSLSRTYDTVSSSSNGNRDGYGYGYGYGGSRCPALDTSSSLRGDPMKLTGGAGVIEDFGSLMLIDVEKDEEFQLLRGLQCGVSVLQARQTDAVRVLYY